MVNLCGIKLMGTVGPSPSFTAHTSLSRWPCGPGSLSGYQTQVQLFVAQEINIERQVLGKRKDSFLEEASNSEKKVDSCPKEPTHHW